MSEQQQWILSSTEQPPEWFVEAVKTNAPNLQGRHASMLLWQRGIQNLQQLAGFLNPKIYQPASPFAFGEEMHLAVERLKLAYERSDRIAIWGDFDADGITATSVLWDGLGQFFPQNTQLFYYIPNRLTESHGLNCQGIARLSELGVKLIVTCDTGSTNLNEIEYAQQLGIDVVVTDHHTLSAQRPALTAIINPRYLPCDHQLFHLSGVAVAYKLVEALYQTLPNIPQQPLEDLLDLVAIGLISDLVQLSGDCRYLAQLGIEKLQKDFKQSAQLRRRPGIGLLLELCHKSGDRPTDISFGLGPRINAVSRIQGDASFCVELLTSRDQKRVLQLAQDTELANTRRKSLQKDVVQQVAKKLAQLDLSTTSVIVLEDPQWPAGVLGLVAGQVAQETGRPTILLSTEGAGEFASDTLLARGSARSVNQIDLYQLVKDQAHLLHRFGGHPFAAGLSLPVENIPLFTQAINQRLRLTQGSSIISQIVQADLAVTVADLGPHLFQELKLLEPCGMGNPVPKLLIQNCWFENVGHRNQQDWRGRKIQYIKAEFNIRDNSTESSFAGVWWGHNKDEIPLGRCDCIVELDYNTYKKRYEIRLLAVRSKQSSQASIENSESSDTQLTTHNSRPTLEILDWRQPSLLRDGLTHSGSPAHSLAACGSPLLIQECPASWDDLRTWVRRSLLLNHKIALAWTEPQLFPPHQIWQQLVGIAKYLSRTDKTVTRVQLHQKLNISDGSLYLGFQALSLLGFKVTSQEGGFQFSAASFKESLVADDTFQAIENFLAAVREEQFQRQYFHRVPLSTIQALAQATAYTHRINLN